MKPLFHQLCKTALHGVVFSVFAVISLAGMVYALTYNWSDPSSIRGRTAGNPLTSSGWNLLVGNVDNLNERLTNAETNGGIVPTGTVIAYNGTSCPNGWTEATGSGVPTGIGGSNTLDLRGEFVRGWDHGRNIDIGRTFGSSQKASRMMGHYSNNFSEFISTSDMECLQSGLGDNLCPANAAYKRNLEDLQSWNGTTNGATSWGSASSTSVIMSAAIRPRNVALLYCVKN